MEQANSIEEFLNIIEKYKQYPNVFYRGQSEKHKSITSSLSRNQGYVQNEYAIYQESIKMKSIEFDGLTEPIEYLSKMQHYGIPTRLIDLSVDPLIALFFAVQNLNSTSSGNVYVYVQQKHSLRDKKVKLLALLATLDSYEIEIIKSSFLSQYGETITEEEVLKYASENAFIEHTEELIKMNDRLFSQRGTFAICGNNVEGEFIKKSINPLDTIVPAMLIRIPYEHKLAVKRELDEKYNINETTIYPELPSVADYLKEKYKSINFSPDGTYSILESKELSNFGAKRISVIGILNKVLLIEEIKLIGREIIEQNKGKYDVIWIYIAKSGDDYIMRNWIVRGQWIKPTLDKRHKPIEIGAIDENDISWVLERSYSTLADYYSENVFSEDKILYTNNMKTFEKIKSIYIEMLKAYEHNDQCQLKDLAERYRKLITKSYIQFGDFGLSRDDSFNKYLNNYHEFSLQLDHVVGLLNRDDLHEKDKIYQFSTCFRELKKNFDAIKGQSECWKQKIGLSDSEYESLAKKEYPKKEYQYSQTIPINPDALKVWFDLEISKNENNIITAKGTTNLFDKASLMISIRNNEGDLLGQSKAYVIDGNFDFGLFSRKGEGYLEGVYEANISLSIPSVQDKKFVSKAGLEYENLDGEYVDRNGIGPTINYYKKFKI
ncbi:FRG domain-containing protein [Rummeliibacillus sp. JY-2-4R]